jgi:hypothetical protein
VAAHWRKATGIEVPTAKGVIAVVLPGFWPLIS